MPSQNKVIKKFPAQNPGLLKKTQTQAASHSALNGRGSPAQSGQFTILNLIIRYNTAIFVAILRGHPGGEKLYRKECGSLIGKILRPSPFGSSRKNATTAPWIV